MLGRSSDQAIQNRSQKIQDCCRYPTIRVDSQGELFFSPSRCRDRLCPLCARIASRQTQARVQIAIEKWDQCRHLTLTLKSTDSPLVEQLDRLIGCFRRVRQRRWWKSRVKGGIGTVEITFNKTTNQWHPHLHLLLDGSYMPHAEISDQWRDVTGDSPIVYITAVHGREEATRYIAKYVTKPADVVTLDQDRAVELAKALSGRRTLIAFGAAHGVKLPVREKGTDHTGSSHVVGLNVLDLALREGQVFAQWAVHRMYESLPSAAKIMDPQGVYKDRGPPAIDQVRTSSLRELLDDCAEWCSNREVPSRYRPPQVPRVPDPTLF